MYAMFPLGGEVYGYEGAVNGSNVPTAITGSMSFRVYGPSGFITSGTATLWESPTHTAIYEFRFTANGPEFERGKVYDVVLNYTVSAAARESIHRFMMT